MLIDNFFTIIGFRNTGNSVIAELEINAGHNIFEGHFPNQPVVPGVCMVQIVKEILEKAVKKKTNLVQSVDIKFLAVIDPVQNNIVTLSMQYVLNENGNVSVNASIAKNELMHFKFKGEFDLLA